MVGLSLEFGWVAFAIVVLVVAAFCYLVVRYYTDRHEAEILPTIVTVAALTLSLLALFLIPVDVSSGAGKGEQIKVLYYIMYALILAFAFVVIPFSYFYYEEYDEDITVKQRIVGGLKYTVFLLVLLIIGIFVKPSSNTAPDSTDVKEWAQFLSDYHNGGTGPITFAVGCLAILGFLVWISYTAYGLSAFPIGLLKGKRHLAEEASDIQSDLETTREQTRAITSKYMTGKKMNSRDEKQLDLLKRQERVLARRSSQIDSSSRGFGRVAHACKPFVFVFGIVLLLVTLLIFILISLIDKIKSSCGTKCGFFANAPTIKNPIDMLLTAIIDAGAFPMDYVIFGSLIVYIFFCTLSGIVKIGVRFLWVHLYSIKPRQTPPQGLLLTAVLLMLSLLVLNMEILTLAPQYATYGSQKAIPINITDGNTTTEITGCTPITCNMTQIGAFVAQVTLGTSFFGNIYYFAMWIFIVTFLIGAVITCVRRKASSIP